MRKYKNKTWDANNPQLLHSWDHAHSEILQDIREELQKLNKVFECHNFLGIPNHLRIIARNTAKKRRKAKYESLPRSFRSSSQSKLAPLPRRRKVKR